MVAKGEKHLGSPPEHMQTLLNNISILQNSDKFIDVIFLCSGGQVPAHRAMLTPLSPLLKELFEVSFKKQSSDVTVISLAGVDVDVVMRLISCIYTGALTSSSYKENMLLREIAELLQIDIKATLEKEKDPVITPKSKGRKGKKDSAIVTSNNKGSDTVSASEDVPSNIPVMSTPTRSRGRPIKNKVNESDNVPASEAIDDNSHLPSEVSPKSPPKRLGGFRSFDTEEIKVAIFENAKTRAENDKMKVRIKNVSKEKNKTVSRLYKSATIDTTEKTFHENIVENPVFVDSDATDESFNMSGGRNSRHSRADLKKKESKQASKTLENESFTDEYEVEEIIEKRELLGCIEYLVKWKGWDDISDRTWEPITHLKGADKLISLFDNKVKQGEKVQCLKKKNKNFISKEDMTDDDYEVEKVLDKRGAGKKLEYLVKWKNFDRIEDQTWEPLENLTESSEIIEAFESEVAVSKKKDTVASVDKTRTPPKRVKEATGPESPEVSSKKARGSTRLSDQVPVKEQNKSLKQDCHIDIPDDDYEVENILDKRGKGKKLEYLVKWKNFEKKEDQTWEPMENLTESLELVEKFEKEHDEKRDKAERRTSKQTKKNLVTEVEEEEEYEIEKILDVREGIEGKEYLVKWQGWDRPEDQTWEPEDSLKGNENMLRAFKKSKLIANTSSGRGRKKKLDSEVAEVIVLDNSKDEDTDALNESVESINGNKLNKRERGKTKPNNQKEIDTGKKDVHSFSPRGRKSNSGNDPKEKDEKEAEYEVEKILDHKYVDGGIQYLVKWLNWDDKDNTWEPCDNLTGAEKIIDNYEKSQKNKLDKELGNIPVTDEDSEFEVERIVDKRIVDGNTEYLVKWKGWENEKDKTWEPEENLVGSEKLIRKYEASESKQTNSKPKHDPSKNIIVAKKKKKESISQQIVPVEDVDEEETEYEVESIVDKRVVDGVTEFLVKWKGWESEEDRTWEPEENLKGSEKLIKRYEASESKQTSIKPKNASSKNIIEVKKKKKEATSQEILPIQDVDEEEPEYEVERIVDKRVVDGVTEYLVKWKGWENEEDQTWEPEENLVGSEKLIKKYEVAKSKQGETKPKLDSPKKGREEKKNEQAPVSQEKSEEDEEESEYEVERIVDKRVVDGVTEYLVKWKGWESEEDRTWEPEENLEGSEKLIKKYEIAESKPSKTKPKKVHSSKKEDPEDGVVLCVKCNRIFLSVEALRSHESTEHKKNQLNTTFIPKIKKAVSKGSEQDEKNGDSSSSNKRKRSSSGDIVNMKCFSCGSDCKSKTDLKNHVLTHYYSELYPVLPASKPFTCPKCSLESRDKVSLVRHYAFTHKEIYKYCTHEQLTNTPAEDDVLDNDMKDGHNSLRESSPVYKPGPKSKKMKFVPFTDETLVDEESNSPTRISLSPALKSPGQDRKFDGTSHVDLSDSSDDEDGFIGNTPKPKSFDDLFSETSDTTKKANEETPIVVFNKDSDDESEKGHADVDDLMGGSDDEKSRNGDNGWDLEDV